MQHLLVVSPHFDDGVFGCGEWLSARPGAAVLTVFAGQPADGVATSWDKRCGFTDSRSAVCARMEEDDVALALLRATPLRLPFLDDQYKQPATATRIAAALSAVITSYGFEIAALPLGLFHSDHRLASEACLIAMRNAPQLTWFAYADALYRRVDRLLYERLDEFAQRGIKAVSASPHPTTPVPEHARRKKAAVACYASQLKALSQSGCADIYAPEQYWRLLP